MCKNHLFFHPCHCCLWFFLTWCDELKTLLSTSSFSHTCVFPRAYGSKRILRCKYFIHALSLQIKRVLREDHETYADLHHSTLIGQDRFQVLFFTIYLNDYADNISVVSLCGGSSMVCSCVDWIKKNPVWAWIFLFLFFWIQRICCLSQGMKLMLVSDCYVGFEKKHSVEELVESQQTEAGNWRRILSIQHIREFPTNICGSALYTASLQSQLEEFIQSSGVYKSCCQC